MDFVKIMWISDLLKNLVLNGCLLLLLFFFFFYNKFLSLCSWMWVFVLIILVQDTHLDLNSYDF